MTGKVAFTRPDLRCYAQKNKHPEWSEAFTATRYNKFFSSHLVAQEEFIKLRESWNKEALVLTSEIRMIYTNDRKIKNQNVW